VTIRRAIAVGTMMLASLYVVFFSVIGYGFGQLFFGTFSWIATVCALSALGAVFGAAVCAGRSWCQGALAGLALTAIACVGLEAVEYYREFDSPGNYFAWEMRVPFVLCLVFICSAHIYGQVHRPNTSFERTRDE
jgi:hypothetical protein